MMQVKRKYVSVDDIHKEYLPVGKKRIRMLLKKYLNVKMIGGRIYVEREALENLLNNPDIDSLPLD